MLMSMRWKQPRTQQIFKVIPSIWMSQSPDQAANKSQPSYRQLKYRARFIPMIGGLLRYNKYTYFATSCDLFSPIATGACQWRTISVKRGHFKATGVHWKAAGFSRPQAWFHSATSCRLEKYIGRKWSTMDRKKSFFETNWVGAQAGRLVVPTSPTRTRHQMCSCRWILLSQETFPFDASENVGLRFQVPKLPTIKINIAYIKRTL